VRRARYRFDGSQWLLANSVIEKNIFRYFSQGHGNIRNFEIRCEDSSIPALTSPGYIEDSDDTNNQVEVVEEADNVQSTEDSYGTNNQVEGVEEADIVEQRR
jgi:hypothetical protein